MHVDVRFQEDDTLNVSMGDVIVSGSSDHSKLINRDAADQHPISAITGLQDTLDKMGGIHDIPEEIYAITVTRKSTSDGYQWTADKTYANIKDAVNAGQTAILTLMYGNTQHNGLYVFSGFTTWLGSNYATFGNASMVKTRYLGEYAAVKYITICDDGRIEEHSQTLPNFLTTELMPDQMRFTEGLLKIDSGNIKLAKSAFDYAPANLGYLTTDDVGKFVKLSKVDDYYGYMFEGASLPDSLKNPNKLTLTGAVSAEYDGSSAVTVNIPTASSGASGAGLTEEQEAALNANTAARHTHDNKSVLDSITADQLSRLDSPLGITGATVGQVPQIASVDENGKPLTWTPIDVGTTPQWYTITTMTLDEQVNDVQITSDADGNSVLSYNPLAILISIKIPADSTQTSSNGTVWVLPQTSITAETRHIINVTGWKTATRITNVMAVVTEHGIVWAGTNNASSGDGFDKSFAGKISGCRLRVNSNDDHFPIGTQISVSILGAKS